MAQTEPAFSLLREPTEEQQLVIDCIAAGNNAVVSAVAGSGKSTVALLCCDKFALRPGGHCLILTYNARLKEDVRGKIASLGWPWKKNVECHSYHALCAKYFCPCVDGKGMLRAMKMNSFVSQPPQYRLVCIDEAQDMTQLYYDFLKHFFTLLLNQEPSHSQEQPTTPLGSRLHTPEGLSQHGITSPLSPQRSALSWTSCSQISTFSVSQHYQQSNPPVWLVCGDPFQQLYEHTGATLNFLTNPDMFFGPLSATQKAFTFFRLSISFRISHEMASYVNENLNPLMLKHVNQK